MKKILIILTLIIAVSSCNKKEINCYACDKITRTHNLENNNLSFDIFRNYTECGIELQNIESTIIDTNSNIVTTINIFNCTLLE